MDRAKSPEQVKHVAEEFESLLLGQLLKALRRTIPEGTDATAARKMYYELFDETLARDLAQKGGIGLAGIIQSYVEQSEAAKGNKR